MKKTCKTLCIVLLAVFLPLLIAVPCASAAGATQVLLNGVLLNAGNPYWKNGGVPATPSDWNAHFDAATSTLTLKDAVINTESAVPGLGSSISLIYADGDLSLVLQGFNTLSLSGSAIWAMYGIVGGGALTISGDGSADITIINTKSDGVAVGIRALTAMNILGGNLTQDIQGRYWAEALQAQAVLYAGGTMDVQTLGANSFGIAVIPGSTRITGGSLQISTVSTQTQSIAVMTGGISLEGGAGVFSSSGPQSAFGLAFMIDPLSYSGGRFTFMGEKSALVYGYSSSPAAYDITSGPVHVSEVFSGAGKRLWTSDADGLLVSYANTFSPFLFVSFGYADPPLTGDGTHPWLWAGIALMSLLSAAGTVLRMRRKRYS